MIVDEQINVSDSRLMNGLIPVIRIMQRAAVSSEDSMQIDFSHTKFISPVFALSLIVFLSKCGKHYSFANLNEYLNIVGFGSEGIRPDRMRWNGTIVAFRIPYNVDKFNYINYIE